MWAFETGTQFFHGDRINFSPDGRWLAVRSGGVRLLDTTGASGPVTPEGLPFGATAWFGLGGKVLVCHEHFATVVRDLEAGTDRTFAGYRDHPRRVVVGPAGDTLYTVRDHGGGRAEIRWYDLGTLELLGVCAGHEDYFCDELAVSADGRWAVTNGYTGVRLWRLEDSGEREWGRSQPRWYHKSPPRAATVALSSDGAFVAAGMSRTVVVWGGSKGKTVWESGKQRCGVPAAAFAPNRPLLATGGTNGTVFLWDAATGKDLARYDWGTGLVRCLTFAPDGLRCAAAGEGGKVVVWDVDV